ncbi:other/FunK1 protein kinase [Coprinopsis cinerea okayama7|uniref:Other/FunK1 protein kinase n=1 Tax=Coprinopsis cinerea (strain Okayama-7 / 130 / ATCC MYA-4618 / FGSC 9003) TaxID=240176 RepID=A8PDR9_COPC7|nr:other/FunK1 protein kinase [Coprinopsis cinerea okayama7\|eukprot:XP_001840652.1 other/FunK1 protein kinase [Coprinopsis cinerea okayama7\
MQSAKPLFKGWDPRGYGITCWNIEGTVDGSMEELLIKDSWISEGWTPEYGCFEDAAGTPGIAALVDWEDCVQLRHEGSQKPKSIWNRTKRRLVSSRYGSPVCNFKTDLEFLCVVSDAIDTHEELVEQDILHWDISTANILVIRSPTIPWHSILIDLDLAVMPPSVERAPVNCRTGTRESQSINVLDRSRMGVPTLPHSYLDDLESFFWVFCIIVTGYDCNGKRVEPPPECIQGWRNADKHAANAKMAFLFAPPLAPVDLTWGKQVQRLFWDLRRFFMDMTLLVSDVAAGRSEMTMEELFSKRVEHYKTVRGHIKKAIDAIKAEEKNDHPNILHRGSQSPSVVALSASGAGRRTPRCDQFEGRGHRGACSGKGYALLHAASSVGRT